jgi:hypothetical protein
MRKLCLLVWLISLLGTATAQKQGIKGQVFWLNGNQMPGPGKSSAPGYGVVREIHIYNAATLTDTQQENGFYSAINTSFVTKVISRPDGSFTVKLPEGRYSVFVKEDKGLFANLFDGKGCINCVTVRPRKYAWVTITVDYEAAY